MLEQIKNIDELNLETVIETQYFDNNSKDKGVCDINLDENKDLKNSRKSKNKTENINKSNKSKNEENNENIDNYKFNKSIKSKDYNNRNNKENEVSDDEENNKTIVKNTYKNSKISNYSFKLTNNLNFALQKGIEEGYIIIEIENNGSSPWPQNNTFLIVDTSKSNINNIPNIQLDPLKPGEETSVLILLSNMNKYNPGKYSIYLDFKVNGKKYNESILINIEITENINKIRHKTIIKAFRNYYNCNKSVFSDKEIDDVIEKEKNFEGAIGSLVENKFK
jgi:hypothetical protein